MPPNDEDVINMGKPVSAWIGNHNLNAKAEAA
jgi:hypothetical protein